MPSPADPPISPVARRMLAFERDAEGDWIAHLDCGHRRHVRHRPPLSEYPWVVDDAAREAKRGATIECARCARLELPDGAAPYRTTDAFDEVTLPSGLRADHSTRAGVWGRVDVLSGQLRFVMPILGVDRVLSAGDHALIPPELVHHVEPLGPMRMRVTFLRAPAGR